MNRTPKGLQRTAAPPASRVMPRRCAAAGAEEVMRQLDAVTRTVGSEVVLESETKTVGVAAHFCFAQFGTPESHDAPDLTEKKMTERERELATCLATPFDGNPEAEGRQRELSILIDLEEQLMCEEVEKKHWKALGMYCRRKSVRNGRRCDWIYGMPLWMRIVYYFAWSKALKFINGKRS